MENELRAIRIAKMGFHRAAHAFGIPTVTLCREVKRELEVTVVSKKKKVYLGLF
jgi:hypothetical protein